MAYTRKQKSLDVAKGAATGAAVNGAVVGGIAVASKVLPIVGKVAATAFSAPVVATVVGGMAVVGATRAYAKTGQAKDAVTGAVAGSFGVFPAFEKREIKREDDNTPRIILAADRSERAEARILKDVNRDLSRAEKGLKKVGVETAVTPPAPAAKSASDREAERIAALPFGQRMVAKTEHAIEGMIFGHDKPKDVVDPFDQRRAVVQNKLKTLNKELGTEVGRGGVGPKTQSLENSIKAASGELTAIDKEERDANAAQSQFYRSAGAAAAGIVVGSMIGNAIKKGASASVQAIEASLAKTASVAGKAAASSPKGVIRGTLEGDKAAAAVATAKSAMAKPVVSAGEAYAVPVVTGGQGVVAYGVAEHLDSEAAKRGEGPNAMATMLRTEATMSMALAGFAAKGAAAARALRPSVSPANAAKLASAENRLAREARGAPAPVAQAKGRAKVAVASGKAAVAGVQAQRNAEVARLVAKGSVERAKINSAAGVDAAKIGSKVRTVEAGTNLGVAKVKGAAAVERAEITAKGANSRAIQRENANPQYKDVWTDKLGRVFHRKDTSVRKAKTGVVANDNAAAVRKGA